MYHVSSIKYFKSTRRIILFILATLYLLLNTKCAKAQDLSLGIDPSLIVVNAIPPTTAISTLDIQNKGDTQVALQIQLKPFKAKGENGELEYSKESLDIFKNIQILDNGLPVENITLGPKQQKTLSLNIEIQPDATASDYYFSIIFISTNTSTTESSSTTNQVGIATNVLLSVGAKEIPRASIEEFSSHIFLEKGPAPFTLRIKNSSTHLIKPKGEITIKNMFGQNVGKLDLTGVNILSGSIRAIPNSAYMQDLRLKDNSSAKTSSSLDFQHPLALWKENFLLGLYAATLNISMSDDGPVFTKTIHFFAFPLQGLIIIIILVIAAIVVRNRLKLYANKNRTKV